MTEWYRKLTERINAVRAWMDTHGPLAKAAGVVVISVLGILAGACLLGVLWLLLRDRSIDRIKDETRIDEEARNAAEKERARLDAMSAHDVVDALPNAGDVRAGIDAGKARVGSLFDAARVGSTKGGGASGNRADG